jgi:hypothetical protein
MWMYTALNGQLAMGVDRYSLPKPCQENYVRGEEEQERRHGSTMPSLHDVAHDGWLCTIII